MKNLMVIDGNNLAWRSHHTTGGLQHYGLKTGVMYGFFTEMIRLADRFNTHRFIFCFDSDEYKRCNDFPAYKHKGPVMDDARKSVYRQMNLLKKEILPGLGFKNILCQKGYESDDLIASACKNNPDYEDLVVTTTDKDIFQLITDRVSVFRSYAFAHRNNLRQLVTLQVFHQQYGIMPEDWVRVKAIAGCRGDKVPGIEGVGELSALKFVRGELPETSRYYKKIVAGKSVEKRNLKLVKLPYPGVSENTAYEEDEVSTSQWDKLVKKLGMETLKGKYPMPAIRGLFS